MKKVMFTGCIALVMLAAFVMSGQISMPGHGNRENRNFEETVMRHVASQLADGERVEWGSRFLCKDYKEDDEVRFAANVIYYVVSRDGAKKKHTAHVICNGDKNRIIKWSEVKDNSLNE